MSDQEPNQPDVNEGEEEAEAVDIDDIDPQFDLNEDEVEFAAEIPENVQNVNPINRNPRDYVFNPINRDQFEDLLDRMPQYEDFFVRVNYDEHYANLEDNMLGDAHLFWRHDMVRERRAAPSDDEMTPQSEFNFDPSLPAEHAVSCACVGSSYQLLLLLFANPSSQSAV